MNSVDPRTLVPGTVTDKEYFSDKGELLIAKGVTITRQHLETLGRRNILEVFTKQSDEEELHDLVSRNLGRLEKISDDYEDRRPMRSTDQSSSKVKAELQQLLVSPATIELDRNIQAHRTADRPLGPPLSSRAVLMHFGERAEPYRKGIRCDYDTALEDVAAILNSLASGNRGDARMIRWIVERFVRMFLKDRSILINISSIKPPTNEYLYHHSLNVCILAINIAAAAGYSESQVIEIGIGALLHDLGMFAVPREIYLKSQRLQGEEWYEIQKHPILGLHMLERVRQLPDSAPYVAYQTHERENGRGYPKMRTSRLIHRFAKIVQIADIYEAMSSPRSYRSPHVPYHAMEKLIKMSRQGFVSSDFVKSFLGYASLFPIGSYVQLSDGRIGRVIQANQDFPSKPVVSVLTDTRGNLVARPQISAVDLSRNTGLQVSEALPTQFYAKFDLMYGF